jgi:enoyl-CoA hydratase
VAVHYRTDGAEVIVAPDRPEAANAIDRLTADELTAAFRCFDADDALAVADPHGRRRPVLRGSGPQGHARGGRRHASWARG